MRLAIATVVCLGGMAILAFTLLTHIPQGVVVSHHPRVIIRTDEAPAAIGPYSQAVVHGDRVFTAGQIALDPETMEMVGGGDPAAETTQVMKNLAAVLEAAGSGFDLAIRCEIYLADLEDYGAVNDAYAAFFEDGREPARVAIQAARLPKDARVEISCVAAVH